jgi:GT2 family glycosyltransferase
MISIIISSRDRKLLENVSENIGQTVGVPFEIIAIENSRGKLGICKAYNEGAARAKYNIFCFMHEDISFVTQDWGAKVIDHLKDRSVGLIGNAGGDPKNKVPCLNNTDLYMPEAHVIAHSSDRRNEPVLILTTSYPQENSVIKRVACVDGMWMCTRRDVFNDFKFDEKTYPGFHGYDIDLSLQILQKYKVCVVFDVLMHHYSTGNSGRDYIEHKIRLNRKWRKLLPLSVRDLPEKELLRLHWLAMETFMNKLIQLDYSLFFILRQYLVFSSNRFFRPGPFLKLLKKILARKMFRFRNVTGKLRSAS